jgi:xanthine/uracil/vitamin C permease (AzgA family)
MMVIKYISIGAALLFIPGLIGISYWLSGTLPRSRAVALLAVVGLFGAWLLSKGIGLLISPKSQTGDASEEIDPDSLFD